LIAIQNKILLLSEVIQDNDEIIKLLRISNNSLTIHELTFDKIYPDLLKTYSPELILILCKTHINIENIITQIKKQNTTELIPFIILAEKKDTTQLKTAFELGAWDYISFPYEDIEFCARINSVLNIISNLKNKLKQQELISKKSDEISIRNNELESLAQITAKLHTSIIILNEEKKIEWINFGAIKLYGITENDNEQSQYDKIKDINPSFEANLINSLKTNEFLTYQSFLNLKSSKKKFVQTSFYPVIIEKEQKKVLVVESDISLLKEKEELLETSREEFLYMIEDLDRISVNFENQKKEFEKQKTELEVEKKKSEELLYNILPVTIAEELKHFNQVEPKYYSNVTVMFADFQSFTKSCENLKFYELVKQLNTYFIKFDEIISKYRIEKIKTIGDAYMCAGGVPIEDINNPLEVILASLEIQKFVSDLNNINDKNGLPYWNLRLGAHTGPVYAGVVGKTKISYDIWGDTVNVASRMESGGEIGKVNVSEATYLQIKDFFNCTFRGEIEAKNKGKVKMYFVHRINPEFSSDVSGLLPNTKFESVLQRAIN